MVSKASARAGDARRRLNALGEIKAEALSTDLQP